MTPKFVLCLQRSGTGPLFVTNLDPPEPYDGNSAIITWTWTALPAKAAFFSYKEARQFANREQLDVQILSLKDAERITVISSVMDS
jgi:hypothetical protein